MEVKTLQSTTSMSILSLSKQPLIWCHIRNRYWYTPRISITFANHDLSMNTQHTCPYECCYISTQSKSPRKVMRLSSISSLWMVWGGNATTFCPYTRHFRQKCYILNSHINCSCPVEVPASILYASHNHKACPQGKLILIWHNDHTGPNGWKHGGQKVCITAWQFSAFNLSRNRCPHSEVSYSTNLSSKI